MWKRRRDERWDRIRNSLKHSRLGQELRISRRTASKMIKGGKSANHDGGICVIAKKGKSLKYRIFPDTDAMIAAILAERGIQECYGKSHFPNVWFPVQGAPTWHSLLGKFVKSLRSRFRGKPAPLD